MMDSQQSTVFNSYPKVSLNQFVPELAYEFTEMPDDVIPHFVLKAINRLARDGNVLRRSIHIHTQECVENYLLEPQDCVDIVAIMSICNVAGNHCGEVTRLTNQPCKLSCGTTAWFEYPNVIHISPARTGNIYRVQVAVAPTFDACEVDRLLLTDYYEIIMAGVKSYLYAMADKPWSSVNRSLEYEQRFIKGISKASIETMMGGQRGLIRTKRARPL